MTEGWKGWSMFAIGESRFIGRYMEMKSNFWV
jgi:hypothetical protein